MATEFNLRMFIKAQRIGGQTAEQTADVLKLIATNDSYIPDLNKALALMESIYKADPNRDLSERLTEYISVTEGYFSVTECDKELQIVTAQAKTARRVAIHRMRERGILEKHPSKAGIYRRVEYDSPVIEWETADISATVPIRWPFQLENYALIYPKNIAVIAGAPNAGKTAFLLNVIKLNMERFMIHYYSSEMGPEEMKLRLSKFTDVEHWVFDARERSSNFADVIYPNDLNIIDYMEITSGEFFRIAEELRMIFDKLNKGIAIIALQKKRGAELGRGAEFSLEKPRLYLSMDAGTLKIIKAKNWAVEGENPNGVEFKFKLFQGARFEEIENET